MGSHVKIGMDEFVNDIRSGIGCDGLMAKYRLSLMDLAVALNKLPGLTLMSFEELESLFPVEKRAISFREMRELGRTTLQGLITAYDLADLMQEGTVTDISRQGLLIRNMLCEAGEIKKIFILPTGFPTASAFELEAECRWTLEEPETGVSLCGFHIRSISGKAQANLEILLAVVRLQGWKPAPEEAGGLPMRESSLDRWEVQRSVVEVDSVFSHDVTNSGSFHVGPHVDPFKRLLNGLPISCWLLDQHGLIVFANEYCRTLGSAPGEFVGSPLPNLFPDAREMIASVFDRVFMHRKVILCGGVARINDRNVPARIGFRAIRSATQRLVLAVVNDASVPPEDSPASTGETEELSEAYKEIVMRLGKAESALVDRTDALRLIINSVDDRIKDEREQVAVTLNAHLKPIVNRLKAENLSPQGSSLVDTLERIVRNILPISVHRLSRVYSSLTPRENEICDLILLGHGTKAIADILGVSAETVASHRAKIRRKLGLERPSQSLFGWLRAHLEVQSDGSS
ncbi:MAG TPA: PAS and helix-turn-helix domain-containing protein [Desulfomonilaceae bacterium]|nr:PAS and helix-turn-helix domain-containing protein [Desulfomonilaceae bacterium]